MSENFIVNAEVRDVKGTGASRRLRHAGRVPAIIYGGDVAAQQLSVEHRELAKHLETEAFYSHVLTIKIGDKEEQAVLKDLQRHPAKPIVMHADFLRKCGKLARRAAKAAAPKNVVQQGANAHMMRERACALRLGRVAAIWCGGLVRER